MKRKLLLAALCVVGAMGGVNSLSAQTDVTSTYLTNADFSGDRTEYSLPSGNTALASDRCIYQPEGWNISVKNKNQYNYSVVKLGDKLQTTDFNSGPYTPTGGKYMVRFRNGNSENEHITLSQTFTMNVSGVYTFSADLIREDGSKIDVTLSAASGSVSNSSAGTWQNRSFDATVAKDASVTVTLKFANKATSGDNKKRAGADNVKIEYKANVNGSTLAALIANAQRVNALLDDDDLAAGISTASGVYNGINNTPAYQATIDGAISDLRSAITTAYSNAAAWNHNDDLTAIISNAGFETTPVFDGTSLGESGTTNAVATYGSTLLTDAVNVYQIAGWDLMTTETSDYARAFTMPYGQTLYVRSNSTAGGQAVTSPSNESSVTTSNNSLLFIETSWCNNAVNGVQQTATLRAGMYKMTFDSYVSSSLSNASSRCGISYGNTTDYKWPETLDTWTNNEIVFTLAEETEVTFSLGYKKTANEGSGSSAFLFVDNVKLTFLDPLQQAQNEWQVVHDALELLDASALPDAAEEVITTALALPVPTSTVEAVNEAKDALQALIDSYDGIKAAYDKVKALITLATNEKDNSAGAADAKSTLATAISTATTNIETRTAADNLTSDYNTLETARRTYVTSGAEPTAGHPFDWTFKLSNSSFESGTTGWTLSKKTTGSWTYEAESYDPAPVDGVRCLNAWAPQINFIEVYQNVILPMGNYSLKGYLYSNGKKSQHIYAYITSDNSSSNLSSSGAWEQLTANFTQSSSSNTSVKLGIYSQGNNVNNDSYGWFRADYFQLFYNGTKPLLDDVIDNATDISTINVGSAPFQIPSSAASTLSGAIDDAQAVYDDDDAYGDDIQDAIDALNTAITTFQGAELIAPEESTKYNLYLSDGGDSYAKTLTFKDGNPTAGTYAIGLTEDAGSAFNQSVHFKAVDGETNQYNIYIEDADGTKHYLCTGDGGGYGGTTEQIRMTTTEANALAVLLVASNTEAGVYYLKNTESSNALIGTSDGGFYTVTSKNKFNINAATQCSVDINIKNGKWATRIFPFAPELPDGLVAYTAEVNGDALNLTEVDTPVANVPYILKNNTGGDITDTSLAGYGTAKEDHYTKGVLTGIYTAATIPAGSYVLQTPISTKVQAFYPLATTLTGTPYRCYLALPNSAAKRNAIFFDKEEGTTSIEAPNATNGEDGVFYNLAGQRVNRSYKGIIIQNRKAKLNN